MSVNGQSALSVPCVENSHFFFITFDETLEYLLVLRPHETTTVFATSQFKKIVMVFTVNELLSTINVEN